MARPPSMTVDEAEHVLGTRGHLSKELFGDTERRTIRKWLTAQGLPAVFVQGLNSIELLHVYNDTSGSLLEQFRESAKVGHYTADPHANEETPKPKTNGHSHHERSLESELASIIGEIAGRNKTPVDIDQVRALVESMFEEKLKDLRPVHRIQLVNTDGTTRDFGETTHPKFPILLRVAQCREPNGYVPNIFLSGEASSGKTTACKQLAKALNLPWHFNGAISMPHEMLGFIDGNGHYHRTPFREAYEHGGVYTFDEVDRSDPQALLGVNPHLANGVATFPDGQIKRHKDCIIICTANTWGNGANADYCGATKLDAAFMSRFPVRLGWNIDREFELRVAGNEDWTKRVQNARDTANKAGLKTLIDTRMSIAGSALIASGFTPDEVAAMTYEANLTDAQKAMLR